MAGNPTPYANGDWFFNKNTEEIQHITNLLEKAFFEMQPWEVSFRTQEDAQAYKAQWDAHKKGGASPVKDWWLNPVDGTIFHGTEGEMKSPWMAFSSEADAKAYLKAHPPKPGIDNPAGAIGSAVSGVGDAFAAVGNFLSKLTEPLFWLRIAEVVIGAAMVIIGMGKMTGLGSDVKSITKAGVKALA